MLNEKGIKKINHAVFLRWKDDSFGIYLFHQESMHLNRWPGHRQTPIGYTVDS